jgi:hypothetical protein
MDIKRVGEAYEEIEKGAVVNGFCNLGVAPPHVAQLLDLFVRDAIRVSGERFDEFQQQQVLRYQAGRTQIASTDRCRGPRVLLTLQLQEPGVAAQSIMTTIEGRDVRGDHFVFSPAQCAICEVHPARLSDGA